MEIAHDGLDRPSRYATPVGASVSEVAEYAYRGPYSLATRDLFGDGPSPALQGTLSYDATRRPLTRGYQRPSDGASVLQETLSWRDRDLKASSTRGDQNGARLAFTYDRAKRLTTSVQEIESAHTADLPDQWSFDYDAAQNLLTKTIADECGGDEAVALPLDGSGRNRPGAVDGTTLEWDSSGNLVRKGDLTLHYDYREPWTLG